MLYNTVFEKDNFQVRYFDRQKLGNPAVWHKDKNDRNIFLIRSNCQVKFQNDNEIPEILTTNGLKIKSEIYHRMILPKDGWCVIGIIE